MPRPTKGTAEANKFRAAIIAEVLLVVASVFVKEMGWSEARVMRGLREVKERLGGLYGGRDETF